MISVIPFAPEYSSNTQLSNNAKLYEKNEIKAIVLDCLNYYRSVVLPELYKYVTKFTLLYKSSAEFDKVIETCVDYEESNIVKKFKMLIERMMDALKDDSDHVFSIITNNLHLFFLTSMSSLNIELILQKEMKNKTQLFYLKLIQEFDMETTLLKIDNIIKRIEKLNHAIISVNANRNSIFM